jgi:hypothetical protein
MGGTQGDSRETQKPTPKSGERDRCNPNLKKSPYRF